LSYDQSETVKIYENGIANTAFVIINSFSPPLVTDAAEIHD